MIYYAPLLYFKQSRCRPLSNVLSEQSVAMGLKTFDYAPTSSRAFSVFKMDAEKALGTRLLRARNEWKRGCVSSNLRFPFHPKSTLLKSQDKSQS